MRRPELLRRIRRSPALSSAITAWHLADTAAFLLRAKIGHIITRWQQHAQKTDGSVWTTVAGRSWIAQPVHQFRSTDAATSSLHSLLSALHTAGVPHEVISTPPELARVVVKDIPSALLALGQSTGSWYQQQDGRIRPLGHRSRPRGDASVLVFQTWATYAGQFLAGADVGVILSPDGAQPRPSALPEFPIDAVITWVDGADPLWQARKRARRAEIIDELHETADNAARYESLDELKYCLRSIEMYAPWIRRIFLVTDQQVPTWLDSADPKVVLVDHTEIFAEPTELPTFNSHAIEARLHHIPGLAEHWLYFNDDFFLTCALAPSFFFTAAGQPKVFLAADLIDDGPPSPTDSPVVAAAKNNRAILRPFENYFLQHRLKHAPYAQLTTLLREVEALASNAFSATASSPFRSPEDLSVTSSLTAHYGLATNQALRGSIRHFYADVTSTEIGWRLKRLEETRDTDVLCLNATTSGARRPRRLQQFLTTVFPDPHASAGS